VSVDAIFVLKSAPIQKFLLTVQVQLNVISSVVWHLCKNTARIKIQVAKMFRAAVWRYG